MNIIRFTDKGFAEQLRRLATASSLFDRAIEERGRAIIEAVQARDYPVVMAATAISALLVVTGNLLADVAAGLVDPRLRGAEAALPE